MDGIWNRYKLKSTRRIYTFGVFAQIETFEQETVSGVIFKQDGAPPHFSCFVTDVLNERFPMPGLEGLDQYPGHLEAQISLHLIFSCGGTLRTLCTQGR